MLVALGFKQEEASMFIPPQSFRTKVCGARTDGL